MRPSILRKILRRRGSVLILVVALLVLLALVGTAYLTTTRFDRSAAVANVVNTQKELVFEGAISYVESNLLDDIIDRSAVTLPNGKSASEVKPPSQAMTATAYRPIDTPLVDAYAADRTPILQWTNPLTGTGTAIPRPVWRSVSWPLFSSADAAIGWPIETPDNNYKVRPAVAPAGNDYRPAIGPLRLIRAYENGIAYKMGEVVMIPRDGGNFDYYIRTQNSLGSASSAVTAPRDGLPFYPTSAPLWEKCEPKQYFSFAPTTVEVDGKVLPAFYVINNYMTLQWSSFDATRHAPYITGPILAGDADGDGIADSIYRKLPVGQLNGITYYLAMRAVDHNSAINLNTAWSNTLDFDLTVAGNTNYPRLGVLPNWGFFPSNVGLREMFHSWNRPNLIGEPLTFYGLASPTRYYLETQPNNSPTYEPLAEITRHNAYRFGYPDLSIFPLGLRPAEDPLAIGGAPTGRSDFTFRSQGEALFTQLARRVPNPGYGDNNPTGPDGNISLGATGDSPLRWIDLPRDGAMLAYKGGVLANIDSPPSDLERRFSMSVNGVGNLNNIDSIYNSADNVRDGSPMLGKRVYTPGTSALNTGTNLVIDRWFDVNFNFDRWYDGGGANRFTLDSPSTTEGLFRSLRPLLVTTNPVSNIVGPRTSVAGRANVPAGVSEYQTSAAGSTTYAQQLINVGDPDPLVPPTSGVPIASGLYVTAPTPDESARLGPAVGTFSVMNPYRQAGASTLTLSSTSPKVSANTADFGELWRAYWNVMAEDWSDVQSTGTLLLSYSGTPFEREIREYERSLKAQGFGDTIFNPYHGMRFVQGATINEFLPGTTNTTLNPAGLGVSQNQSPAVPKPPDAVLFGANEQIEQHPARMFRSPIRSFVLNRTTNTSTQYHPPLLPTAPYMVSAANAPLPRLRPDQMVLLRSALAAVNAEDMRDTDFKVTRRTIKLRANGQVPVVTTPAAAALNPEVAVTINGYEPQPFITEVYAETNTAANDSGGGTANDGTGGAPYGYIAIELHNPYPFPIDIRYCKFATINRYDEAQAAYPGLRVVDTEDGYAAGTEIRLTSALSNMGLARAAGEAYMTPTVVPANGYLVLESYDAHGAGIGHRPTAMDMRPLSATADFNGPINPPADARLNVAYVPNLSKLFNREFILMRPIDVETQLRTAADGEPLPVTDPNLVGPNADRAPRNGFVRRQMESLVTYSAADPENTSVRTLLYADPVIFPDAASPLYRANAPRTPAVDMVPLDSFDLTGLALPGDPVLMDVGRLPVFATPGATANAWHYVRANTLTDTATGANGEAGWRFVYPGRYDASKYAARVPAGLPLPRQAGTRDAGGFPNAGPGGWTEVGGINPVPAPSPNFGRSDNDASYQFSYGTFVRGPFAMPLSNFGFAPFGIQQQAVANAFYPAVRTTYYPQAPVPAYATQAMPAGYPFGGFARNGDLLEVPFIGSYRIQFAAHIGSRQGVVDGTLGVTAPASEFVIELNSITMDAAMAEDTDVNDDPIVGPTGLTSADSGFQSREQIGRFVPLRKTWLPNAAALTGNDSTVAANRAEVADYSTAILYDDTTPNTATGAISGYTFTNLNRYRWTSDLFDYLTVQSPSDDFLPNLRLHGDRPNFALAPSKVRNVAGATSNSVSEVNLPVEGQANINSASERVLAMLPWVPILNNSDDRFRFTFNPGVGYFDVTYDPNGDGVADNLQMARAIVQFRQGFEARAAGLITAFPQANFRARPFLSIWDLYRVPEFSQLQSLLLDPNVTNPAVSLRQVLDDRVGDLSPFPYDFATTDFTNKFFNVGDRVSLNNGTSVVRYVCVLPHLCNGPSGANAPPNATYWRPEVNAPSFGLPRARFDFEEQSLMLNRVSNLITTRSDMFTAYVLIEGWENAGTPKAELKVSKRAAFFLDRSQTTPGKIELKAPIPIPTE